MAAIFQVCRSSAQVQPSLAAMAGSPQFPVSSAELITQKSVPQKICFSQAGQRRSNEVAIGLGLCGVGLIHAIRSVRLSSVAAKNCLKKKRRPRIARSDGVGMSKDLYVSLVEGLHWSAGADREELRVEAAEWDALISSEESVFLEYHFLAELERSDCVSVARGWQPRFLIVRERAEGKLVGAVPMYLKRHSEGEFIEDYDWIRASRENQFSHWPRLFVGIPYTPHCGARLLAAPWLAAPERLDIKRRLVQELVKLAQSSSVSLNVAFSESTEDAEMFAAAGFLARAARQAWWHNTQPSSYNSFESFLDTLRVKNATEIRKQREAVQSMVDVEVIDGSRQPEAITEELMNEVYKTCYLPTQARHGRLPQSLDVLATDDDMKGVGASELFDSLSSSTDLTGRMFARLAKVFRHRVLLILAKARHDEGSVAKGSLVGGALCFVKGKHICGRYWGYRLDAPRTEYLHFECCYYALIEHAIKCGYTRIEPGNGGSGKVFKVQRRRGFEPESTPSWHYIPHDALRQDIVSLIQALASEQPNWTKGKYSAYKPARKPK
eukprot:TRINITY_DN27105_c0_g2_i1.p1 TRINITY_DN27105_c0_g2~~TRINITY_DN27105_c0_g2_i1.p1  ORF type:complete len:552 (+),score=69.08 TRINITY_DN27105_c0_g2_i1:125-1780(+)